MMTIPMYQVDAFTVEMFHGNPAAVCVLDEWLDDETMQSIGAENNLAETAFIKKNETGYDIRWFTPQVEIDLCGHATLASAYVVFHELGFTDSVVHFHSRWKGELSVEKQNDILILDFPSDQVQKMEAHAEVEEAIGEIPVAVYHGESKLMAVLENEAQIRELKLDFSAISQLNGGLIVTAPGEKVDFVSRFFVPQFGINEDPVTGSAHTLLIPYWAKMLNKKKLIAQQLSKRGGTLFCEDAGNRVKIGGKAVLFLRGEIYV